MHDNQTDRSRQSLQIEAIVVHTCTVVINTMLLVYVLVPCNLPGACLTLHAGQAHDKWRMGCKCTLLAISAK